MNCSHNHEILIDADNHEMAVVYGRAIVLGTLCYLAYDSDTMTGCFTVEEVDQDALACVPDSDAHSIQLMVFDSFSIHKDIGDIDIYDKSFMIDITELKINTCYQFCIQGKKVEKSNNEGMVRNPITGRWSFL